MKSPLKDIIEFKSSAALKRIIPTGSTVSTLLLYGATMELSLARNDCTVVAHTNKYPVYEFWKYSKEDSTSIAAAVQEFYPQIDTEQFYYLQQSWAQVGNPLTRSAFFFILNRCSSRGSASIGKIDKNNFGSLALGYLRNFKGDNFYPLWDEIENPLEALEGKTESDYWVIPAGKFSFNLFEEGKSRGSDTTSFNHRELRERIVNMKIKALVVYKSHPSVFKLYRNCNLHMVNSYGKPTSQKDKCEEIIVANF
jgi:hypothetical protein